MPDRTLPVSDPDVSRPRLIRDARFLEADRREIALRRGRHTGEAGTALLEAGAVILEYLMQSPVGSSCP